MTEAVFDEPTDPSLWEPPPGAPQRILPGPTMGRHVLRPSRFALVRRLRARLGFGRHPLYGTVAHVFWWWRLLGWALFATAFALISPRFAPLGILAFELVVILLGQWNWYRIRPDRRRRRRPIRPS